MLATLSRLSKTELSPKVPEERFRFASVRQDPLRAIAQRVLLAIGLLLVVTLITYIGRDGYTDSQGDSPLTFIDALYYSTVTITTTGYGDIVPATQTSRLITTVVVTPLRVIFLILLVGTTLQVLADQSRIRFRRDRLEKKLRDHIVVCGFGVKGRSALEYMRNHRDDAEAITIDTSDEALEEANSVGITGISGSATDPEILKAARVDMARTVIVAPNSDEQAVLITLRVKELNPRVNVVASCREEHNVELLKQSGADEVIVSSSSAGRILGMAAEAPEAARVVNDLLTFGDGLDINERLVETDNEPLHRPELAETTIAVVRDDRVLRPGDTHCVPLRKGDLVIFINTTEEVITRSETIS